MKRGSMKTARLGACALLCWTAYSQNSWEAWMAAGDRLREQGRYGEAEQAYGEALGAGGNDERRALALNNRGYVRRVLGKYGQAEADLEQSLEIKKRVFGAQHAETAVGLNNLAELYRAMGRSGPGWTRRGISRCHLGLAISDRLPQGVRIKLKLVRRWPVSRETTAMLLGGCRSADGPPICPTLKSRRVGRTSRSLVVSEYRMRCKNGASSGRACFPNTMISSASTPSPFKRFPQPQAALEQAAGAAHPRQRSAAIAVD
ncbi:MAG: tetratricopeptide repeat protein, partial [Armatimonadetes bacterium]|nr:tetratricopeptide repeat protein [Armatimonadota bacterium]